MKNYIWEKAFKRTWLSTHWDEFHQGILEIANYIRLSGGETRDMWHGYHGDFSENDKELLAQDKYILPYVYFSFQSTPYIKYEREAEVVEKITREKNISIQNYLDWISVDEVRQNAEEEYEKSPITTEWQVWEKNNEDFFKKVDDLVAEYNNENKRSSNTTDWRMIVWEKSKEIGLLCLSAIMNEMDLHDPAVIVALGKEKREELHTTSLQLFKDFGEFLKNKFLHS